MSTNKHNAIKILLSIAVLIFFAILFLRTAWLCDDAYITFRVVDNFVNGYGLRWNVNERVQAYTHPLWLFLHIPFYAITREMFLTPIFISISISIATIAILSLFICHIPQQLILLTSILGFSRAFIDYSTSGLENPLTHLLLTLFFAIFISHTNQSLSRLFILSLLASLSAVNRLDTILIYIPALFYVFWHTHNKRMGILILILGFLPIFAWELFSIVYYGFPFPNTAYAKLQTGISKTELIQQGFYYYLWLLKHDLITFVAIFSAIAYSKYSRRKDLRYATLGIIAYGLYILWIGGDFMGGRFFTPPLVLATIILLQSPNLKRAQYAIPTSLLFIILSLVQPNSPILTDSTFGTNIAEYMDEHGIANERKFYFQVASLAQWKPGKIMPNNSFALQGRQYRALNQRMTRSIGCIGYHGFFSGPLVHIVDYHALADPLLARLPTVYRPKWRIGHFWRYVPQGYLDSAGSDENKIKDEKIAQFYEHIKIITRGNIWSYTRWKDIIKMNLGLYDHLIDQDQYRFPNIEKMTLTELKERLQTEGKMTIPKYGLEIQHDTPQHCKHVELELPSTDTIVLLFFSHTTQLGQRIIYPLRTNSDPYTQRIIKAPFIARYKGYNKIRIFTYPGDEISYLRELRLH